MSEKQWYEKIHWIKLVNLLDTIENGEIVLKFQDKLPVSAEIGKVDHKPKDLTQ